MFARTTTFLVVGIELTPLKLQREKQKAMKKGILTALLATGITIKLIAQQTDTLKIVTPQRNTPIPVEAFAGDQGMVFQMIVSKRFTPNSRFGFFNVTSIVGDYAAANQQNQFLTQAFITANIWKGFSVNAGASLNDVTGFRPSAGLQYVFANKQILAVIIPRCDLSQTYNVETFGLLEYKPKFNKNWGLYTRAQGLYNHNTRQNFHDRSYVWIRLGASYKQFQFGLGANVDFYGPGKMNENSFGVFVRAELF